MKVIYAESPIVIFFGTYGMYLVDPRISSDPHDLLSIHTSTYLFFARPTQRKVREAWLRDPLMESSEWD